MIEAFDPAASFGPEVAARHLTPDGHFVAETALPHDWIAPSQTNYVHGEHVGINTIVLDVARYDPVTQLSATLAARGKTIAR